MSIGFRTWVDRTLLNWRWWVILPLIVLSIPVILVKYLCDEFQELFSITFEWQKKGRLS